MADQLNLGATALQLAVAIADDAAREDIESFAVLRRVEANGGYYVYSLTEANMLCQSPEDAQIELAIVQRAAGYIRARGNVFPWRMIDADGFPGCVRFVDPEGRPVDPGARV